MLKTLLLHRKVHMCSYPCSYQETQGGRESFRWLILKNYKQNK